MATVHSITANSRKDEGKGASRRLRLSGHVPAIVYGAKIEPQCIQFEHNHLWMASQNEWFYSSILSLSVDGTVQKVRYGSNVDSQWLKTHPVSGLPVIGITLPHWQKVVDLAIAAHAVVPDNGILGWDIALTPDGATLIECNENTGHGLYQLASGRGILNADFAPAFTAVKARNIALISAFDARRKAYQRAKARA